MRPFNSINREDFPSNIQSDLIYQGQISRTPQRNKSEKRQVSTAAILELTPLMSPARLGRSFLSMPSICRLEYVQTPCRSQGITIFGDNALNEKMSEYPFSMIIFEPEEKNFDESSPSSREQSQSQNENHQHDENRNNDSEEFQSQNMQAMNSNNTFGPRRPSHNNLDDSNENGNSSKKCVCNCKKTQCLKLYCDCFREGESCGSTCQCNSCHNTVEFEEQRSQVRQLLMKRNPEAFKPKIQNEQHSKGCNCKKTFCVKKYCECFQAGLQCGSHCKCEECNNGKKTNTENSIRRRGSRAL